MSGSSGLPDWRDAAAYDPLLQAERCAFAWEWLRRSADYRRAATDGLRTPDKGDGFRLEQPDAAQWGLHVFEDPFLPALHARPVWSSARHAFVLRATAERSRPGADSLELDHLLHLATLVEAPTGERLLLSDGRRAVRLDVEGAGLREGPVRLEYRIHGFAAAEAPLTVLRRLAALASTGRFSGKLHPPDRRSRRQILLLRAHDALAAGADQRTIAGELLSERAARANWRFEAPSLRSQAQRLVRGARLMSAGAFWPMLQ